MCPQMRVRSHASKLTYLMTNVKILLRMWFTRHYISETTSPWNKVRIDWRLSGRLTLWPEFKNQTIVLSHDISLPGKAHELQFENFHQSSDRSQYLLLNIARINISSKVLDQRRCCKTHIFRYFEWNQGNQENHFESRSIIATHSLCSMLIIEKVAHTLNENAVCDDVNVKKLLGFAQSPT